MAGRKCSPAAGDVGRSASPLRRADTSRARARARRAGERRRAPRARRRRPPAPRDPRRTCSGRGPACAAATRSASRLTPRNANSDRQRTSQPGASRRRPRRRSTSCRARARAALRGPRARDPDEARLVAGGVLDVAAQDLAAVQLGRERGAERRARPAVLGDRRTASAVELAASSARACGSRVRRKWAHCAVGLRMGDDGLDRASASSSRAIRQWWIGWTSSPTIATPSASIASASSVALTDALDRVLDRHERAVDLAVLHGDDAVVDRRQRDELAPVARRAPRAAPRGRRCPRAEVAHAHQRDPASRRRPRAASASRDRLLLLRRQLELALARRARAWRTAAPGRGGWMEERTTPCGARRAARSSVDWWPDISPYAS